MSPWKNTMNQIDTLTIGKRNHKQEKTSTSDKVVWSEDYSQPKGQKKKASKQNKFSLRK